MQAGLARIGYPRHPWEPAGEWATRLARTDLNENITADLRKVVNQHYRRRFHSKGLSPDEETAMEKTCRRLLKQMDQSV